MKNGNDIDTVLNVTVAYYRWITERLKAEELDYSKDA